MSIIARRAPSSSTPTQDEISTNTQVSSIPVRKLGVFQVGDVLGGKAEKEHTINTHTKSLWGVVGRWKSIFSANIVITVGGQLDEVHSGWAVVTDAAVGPQRGRFAHEGRDAGQRVVGWPRGQRVPWQQKGGQRGRRHRQDHIGRWPQLGAIALADAHPVAMRENRD